MVTEEFTVDPETPGWVVRVTMPPPSLQDNSADADRLSRALMRAFAAERIHIDLDLRKQLPGLLREGNHALRCIVLKDQGCAVLVHAVPDAVAVILGGLAVDLGTTRVVLRLVDLERRRVLAETAFDNPQTAIGPDVLARIHHADQPDGLAQLQEMIVTALNRHAQTLCRTQGLTPENLHVVSVAGNTAMSHLLAGLPVHWMIREPYIPATNRFDLFPAAQIGLKCHPQAQVLLFPNVGSYFGGDLIAGILYSGLHRRAGRDRPRAHRPAHTRFRYPYHRRSAAQRNLRLRGDRSGCPALHGRYDRYPRQVRPDCLRRSADGQGRAGVSDHRARGIGS